ncbi:MULTISPECIES: YeeE/YedE thiosulfate transporter family protein [Micrococcaceae]|uniref:YeeE/YedE thiosulfate transporter family protein n=1 Tax=unclassified Kocuria TaxID=2649579 RepID=UPI001012367E
MIFTGLIVGALLGVVMQRGRFCVTGMLRDIFLQRSWRTFTALMVVIAVHAVGIAVLTSTGVISPEYSGFAPIAVVVGSLLFGLGIILAGGCASGTWYRSAEGLVGSWIALAMYALSSAAMKKGALGGFAVWMKQWDTGLTTIPEALGISPWVFVILVSAVTVVMVRHFLRKERRIPKPATLGNRPAWKRPLHFYTAGVLVGLIGVIAWPLSAAAGRNDGLGITTPSSNLVKFMVTGNDSNIDWGVMLVLGLFVGAFIAAKASGEFRIRVPDARTATRSVAGGLMMGVGASLAGGCTVGNGMVQTSLFSFQGWVSLVFIALGVGLGAKLWLRPTTSRPTSGGGTYTTSESLDNTLAVASDGRTVEPAPVGTGSVTSGAEEVTTSASVNTAPAAPPSSVQGFGGFPAALGAVGLKEKTGASSTLRELGEGYYALDSLGAVCPFPLIDAKDVMATLDPGDHLVIDFDCTQATEAIPHWAAEDGHEITDFREQGEASWQITLRKG